MLQIRPGMGDDVQRILRTMEEQVFAIKSVMERLANLTTAHTKRYPALVNCEIIDLAREDSDAGSEERPDR